MKFSKTKSFLSGSLSLHFNGHVPGGPGLVGTRMSPFWISTELRVMEVTVTTGAIRRAKLQSKCHHRQTNTQFFTERMSFLSPNNIVNPLWIQIKSIKSR